MAAAKTEWQQIGETRYMAKVGHLIIYAGQNDDGSFFWSDGVDKGRCSAPMYTYQGITNPQAYIAAAIKRCQHDAEVWAEKYLAALNK